MSKTTQIDKTTRYCYRVLNESTEEYLDAAFAFKATAVSAALIAAARTGRDHSLWTEDENGNHVNTGDYFDGEEELV